MHSCGILLHITSLPDKYGIGTLGKQAYRFVDFLVKSGQEYWQLLPIGPTGFGDSPYQSYSAYAGNPLLIDLEKLIEEGLLDADDTDLQLIERKQFTDFGQLDSFRQVVLKKACKVFLDKADSTVLSDFQAFCNINNFWFFSCIFNYSFSFSFNSC